MLDQSPFCGASDSDYPCFGLGVTLSMGFKARVVLLPACLHAVILRVTSGATPAFSTNMDVHCISVFTAGPLPHIPHASRGGWAAVGYGPSLSAEARSSSEHAITEPCRPADLTYSPVRG